MYYIALRMLFGDKSKFILLICSLTFASLLITQQSSVFCGLIRWSTAILRNTQASIWVVDPNVEQVNESRPMRDIELQRVRSVQGVKWAMPLSFAIMQARLPSGHFEPIQLMGLDAATLTGAPHKMIIGRWEDLSQDKAVVVDQIAIERFSDGYGRTITLGDTFEINDREVRVVGICQAERSFFGSPFVFTTFERANEVRPSQRKVLSYVIAEPDPQYPIETVVKEIIEQTGLKAYAEDDFAWSTIDWFFRKTGIPISFGTTVLLGFLVGVAVAGQTFYAFVYENMPHFGALKAMGATNGLLLRMMLLQAYSVGFIGFGMGLGISSAFGRMVLVRGNPPFFMTDLLVIITFIAIFFICTFSVILGARKIMSLEPAEVFRG